jgi:hypothetical protein
MATEDLKKILAEQQKEREGILEQERKENEARIKKQQSGN